MRIAYVTETWPPEVNGVALTAERTVAFLRDAGHDIELIRPRQSGEVDIPGQCLCGSVPIPMYRDLRMGLPARGRLVERWSKARVDLVHVATEGPLGWSAVAAARALHIPVSSDYRTRFDVYTRFYAPALFTALVGGYLRAFHNRCQLTFVPTEELKTHLEAHGFERLAVSARGVDCAAFTPQARDASLRARFGDGPLVLTVGRIAREKNLLVGLKVFRAIQAVQPASRWILVGDGPYAKTLQRLCPDAILVGTQRGADLARYFASADMFLFPSLSETFGNVTLEALASGVPVLAFDTAAAALHVRAGQNGFLAPPGDVAALIEVAQRLAADPLLRQRLAAGARRSALGVDWKTVLASFEHSLSSLAQPRPDYEHALVA